METESAFDVVEESVGGVGLKDGDDIHEADRELGVLSDLAVNSDVAFFGHDDELGLFRGKGELELVSEENVKGNAFSQSVGTLGRLGSPDSA